MYKLNILSTIKKMTIKELRDFIHKNYYRRIGFPKENNYYSMKHQEKRICYCLQLLSILFEEKNSETIKNSYATTKSF